MGEGGATAAVPPKLKKHKSKGKGNHSKHDPLPPHSPTPPTPHLSIDEAVSSLSYFAIFCVYFAYLNILIAGYIREYSEKFLILLGLRYSWNKFFFDNNWEAKILSMPLLVTLLFSMN